MASTLGTAPIRWARYTIPRVGIPHLECELSTDQPLPTGTGSLSLEGSANLVTITRAGDFAGKQRASAVGGYYGWSQTIPAKGYASPVGIATAKLITDAARECGEVPGVLPTTIIGGSYARRQGAASRVLQAAGVDWWIDSAGITQTGTRSSALITDPALTVLDYDPADGELLLGAGDVSQYTPGRTISTPTVGTLTLDLLTIMIRDNELRVQAWTTG